MTVTLPQLGLTMTEGTIARWCHPDGARVSKGDPLFELETDKATFDVEAPAEGVLRILVPAAQPVAVGAAVATIGDGAQPPKVRISPRARRLAEEHNLDWRTLPATGADGEVTVEDVRRAIPAEAPAPAVVRQPLSPTRQTIAARLSASQRERVHIHLTMAVDMTAARTRSLNDLFIKAAATCLTEFPLVNSTLVENQVELHPHANIGFAVAVDDQTLLVPVVREAERLSPARIREVRSTLVAKARERRLTPDEMSGGTFTISNLGAYGVEQFTAVINPPETAILAIGAMADECRVIDGMIAVRPMLRATLAVDHRVVDGALAARFLARWKALIENPEALT